MLLFLLLPPIPVWMEVFVDAVMTTVLLGPFLYYFNVRPLTCQIADLKRAEEALLRKEKLATLGKIAGIVGHEIRNPLGVMSNAVFYLNTVLTDADESIKEYLNIIKEEISISEQIVADLLDFARTKTPQKRAMDIKDLINGSLAKCKIPENIRIEKEFSETMSEANIDPTQMTQAFVNIIMNAVDAMPDGGSLKIKAENDKAANALEVIIEDSGAGMSPENMKYLFQPLFTTKAKGLGLGLTTVKNLTEANGGKVEVESEQGKGTRFKILLKIEDLEDR